MTAEGWTPGLKTTGGGVNTSTTFVKASEGAWQTIHARPSAGAASYPSGTRTTPARELGTWSRYLSLPKKETSLSVDSESDATP